MLACGTRALGRPRAAWPRPRRHGRRPPPRAPVRRLDPDSDPSPSKRPLSLDSDTSPSTLLTLSPSSVADPEVRRVLALLRKASELVYRVHGLVEGSRSHMGAAESLLLTLGLGGHDRDSAPWVHPPCIAEQLEGAMYLGEALDLLRLTAAALSLRLPPTSHRRAARLP